MTLDHASLVPDHRRNRLREIDRPISVHHPQFPSGTIRGIFLVAKADAANEYVQLAASEDRGKDVIVFRPNTPARLNF